MESDVFSNVHNLQRQQKHVERYIFHQTLSPLVYLYRHCICFFLTISLTHLRIVYKTFLTFDTIRCRYFLYSVDYLVFIIAVSTTLHDSNPSHYTKIPVRFFLTGIFCILMPWIKAPPRCALFWNALRRSRSGGSGGRPLHWCGFRHRCAGSAGSPP